MSTASKRKIITGSVDSVEFDFKSQIAEDEFDQAQEIDENEEVDDGENEEDDDQSSDSDVDSQKRSIDDGENEEDDVQNSDVDSQNRAISEKVPKRVSCSNIRTKIKVFLASKEMTQTEFLKQISCGPTSLKNFLKLKGDWNGTQNGVYWGALDFFDRREKQKFAEKVAAKIALESLPKEERKRRKLESSSTLSKQKKGEMTAYLQSIVDYELPESFYQEPPSPLFRKKRYGPFPVFDDCDVVRKKSLEFIASKGITTAEFLRYIDVTPNIWRTFLQYTGKGMGAAKTAYPKAYLFLEKLRLKEGLPKSKLRLKNEVEWPHGFELVHASSRHFRMLPGTPIPKKYHDLI